MLVQTGPAELESCSTVVNHESIYWYLVPVPRHRLKQRGGGAGNSRTTWGQTNRHGTGRWNLVAIVLSLD
jgi:hypothetical protein